MGFGTYSDSGMVLPAPPMGLWVVMNHTFPSPTFVGACRAYTSGPLDEAYFTLKVNRALPWRRESGLTPLHVT